MTARLPVLGPVALLSCMAMLADGTRALDAPTAVQATTTATAPATPASWPDSPGVEVAKRKCIGCHEADLIVSQRLSPVGWDREVTKMERWGATLATEERTALVGYLTRQFGVRPTPSHDAQAVAAGEVVYQAACRVCHEDDLAEQQRLTIAAWGREVDKMVRWGARVTADEKGPLVAYLTSRWGHP